jgi:hypothetical protein
MIHLRYRVNKIKCGIGSGEEVCDRLLLIVPDELAAALYAEMFWIAAAASNENLLSVISETPAMRGLLPFASWKTAFPFGTVPHKPFPFPGGKDIPFHDSGADAANGYILKVVRMPHYMHKPYLPAAAELTGVKRRLHVIFSYIINFLAMPS